jgi:hypothetical protein
MKIESSHFSREESQRNCVVDCLPATATKPPAGQSERLKFKFACFVTLLLLVTAFVVRADTGYEIHGKVEYRFWVAGNIADQETNSFSITAIDCRSQIRVSGIPTPEGRQVESYEHISTPDLSWFTTIFKEQPNDSLRNQDGLILDVTNKRLDKVYNAYVDLYTNPFPPVHIGLISPVWLAYASRCALGPGKKNMIYPMSFMGPGWPDINGNELKCEVYSSTEAPYLPDRIVEYADESVFEFVSGVQQRYLRQPPLPELYRQGFTNSIFEVLSWTNINNLHLPLHFQLIRYVPKSHGESNKDLDVLLVYEGYGELFDANTTGQIVLPEKAQSWSRVDDYRYASVGGQPYLYTSKSGRILSFKELQELKPGGFSGETIVRSNTILVRSMVIGLMISPLIFLFVWNYWKGKKQLN